MKKRENHAIRFLAARYLRGRANSLISPNHYLTLAGITLGVIALLCVSSVMNGFREDIGMRIVGTQSQLRISKPSAPWLDYQKTMKELQAKGFASSAVIRNELLIKRGSVVLPAICLGVNLDDHARVSQALSPLKDNGLGVRQGIIAGKGKSDNFESEGIILSAGLAMSIGAYVGDEVQIISPRMSIPTAFGMIPRVKSLKVTSLFESAMPEFQQSFAYMSLSNASFFSAKEGIDQLEVMGDDFVKAEQYARLLQNQYPQLKVEPWSRFDASLYSAIRFEKFLMFVIMLLMYVIASFNLTGSMLKSIAQKKRELGLLKSIGFTDLDLKRLFLRQSLILSSLGIVMGMLIASLLLYLQAKTGFVTIGNGNDAMILPVKVMVTDYLIVLFVSYSLTLLSVALPLVKLKQVDPIALIRQTT